MLESPLLRAFLLGAQYAKIFFNGHAAFVKRMGIGDPLGDGVCLAGGEARRG